MEVTGRRDLELDEVAPDPDENEAVETWAEASDQSRGRRRAAVRVGLLWEGSGRVRVVCASSCSADGSDGTDPRTVAGATTGRVTNGACSMIPVTQSRGV